MKPYRNKKILQAARDEECVRCGAHDGTVVAAHYSGLWSIIIGKGMGQKPHDFCVAFLCHKCHRHFDMYEAGNDFESCLEFCMLIFKTQRILFDREVIK